MVTRESLARIESIARDAGIVIMRHYRSHGQITLKADHSPLTDADREAHHVITRALAEWDNDIPVISEEGTLPPFEQRQGWRRFWLVDPLDGTKEFLSSNGEFTVNIALIENGEPVLGVVYAPAIDVMYAAGRGLGSWKSTGGGAPERLHGPSAPGREGLVVVESRSHPSSALEDWLKTRSVLRRVQAGSSLKFGLVAEGLAHVYPRFGQTHDWDVAAGDCVWRNASDGGERPSPIRYNSPALLNDGFVIGVGA